MASRIGRRSTCHREIVLRTAFSEVTFFFVPFLAELFLFTFLSAVSLAAASSSLACSLAFFLLAISAFPLACSSAFFLTAFSVSSVFSGFSGSSGYY